MKRSGRTELRSACRLLEVVWCEGGSGGFTLTFGLVFAPVDEVDVAVCIDLDVDRVGEKCLVQCLGVTGEVFVCVWDYGERIERNRLCINLSRQLAACLLKAVAGYIAFAEYVAVEVWMGEAGK